ncbi:MAG TPA: DUF1707 domain-containing protein [Trebonia sp.]|jgi:hypothetical protein|nr:DUF1707 domain-containing protein [Trebonia sp.]
MSDQEQAGRAPAGDGRGALRVSHEDRDQVAEALRVAAGDGRLSSDELDERLERALTARTYDELAVLVADLPPAGNALALAPGTQLPGPLAAVLGGGVAPAPAKELIKIHVTSGHSQRVGRWTVPARMDLNVRSGHVKLDFTEAVIAQPTLHIDAEVSSGHILLLTRPGIAVDLDDVAVRSGHVKAHAPWGENVPVFLRISVAGKCGSGHILARPPRRSFWQWLRRAPRRYAIAA